MRNASKWLAALVVVALMVALVAVAGCSTPAATTTEPTTKVVVVKVVKPGVLQFGSDTAFPPFETMNGAVAEGFDVDLGAAIAKELGLTSEFVSQKFDTLIPQLKAGGKFDAVMSGMTITDERKKEIDFSDPYIDSNQSVAVLKDKGFTVIKTGDTAAIVTAMNGKTIGVQSGTTGEAWAKENLKGAKQIIPFDDTLAAFSALQAGKVDAVVNDLPVSAAVVKDPARNAMLIAEIPTGEQYGIAIAKTTPDLTKAVNEALAKIKASGEYAKIYQKWFGTPPPTASTPSTPSAP
jgi:polar amino acid transport system substrate-binding protein